MDNASALVGTCCQHAANVLHGHWGTIQWIMHLLWLEHAVNMLPMCCMDAGGTIQWIQWIVCGSNEKDITESIPCGYNIVITCKKFLQ